MRYFLDTEFIESGPSKPIQLISIGIVAEDGREFYAINLLAAVDRKMAINRKRKWEKQEDGTWKKVATEAKDLA